MKTKRNIILRYTADVVGDPIIYLLVKEYNLVPNIVQASINPDKKGYIIIGVTGEEEDYLKAIRHLESLGISVQQLVDKVNWDEGKCTQCGACTAVCPSSALYLVRPHMNVAFDGEKCVVCRMCLEACPVNAVSLNF